MVSYAFWEDNVGGFRTHLISHICLIHI